jgi:hypothetical protein
MRGEVVSDWRDGRSEQGDARSAFVRVASVRGDVGSALREGLRELRHDVSELVDVVSEDADDLSEERGVVSALEDDVSMRRDGFQVSREDVLEPRRVPSLCPQDIGALRDDIEEHRDVLPECAEALSARAEDLSEERDALSEEGEGVSTCGEVPSADRAVICPCRAGRQHFRDVLSGLADDTALLERALGFEGSTNWSASVAVGLEGLAVHRDRAATLSGANDRGGECAPFAREHRLFVGRARFVTDEEARVVLGRDRHVAFEIRLPQLRVHDAALLGAAAAVDGDHLSVRAAKGGRLVRCACIVAVGAAWVARARDVVVAPDVTEDLARAGARAGLDQDEEATLARECALHVRRAREPGSGACSAEGGDGLVARHQRAVAATTLGAAAGDGLIPAVRAAEHGGFVIDAVGPTGGTSTTDSRLAADRERQRDGQRNESCIHWD